MRNILFILFFTTNFLTNSYANDKDLLQNEFAIAIGDFDLQTTDIDAKRSRVELLAQALKRVTGVAEVELEEASIVHFIHYQKSADERIENIVVNKLQGCKSYDEKCQRVVKNLNRRSPDEVLGDLDAHEGDISLPSKSIRFILRYSLASPKRVTMQESYKSFCGYNTTNTVHYTFAPTELRDFLDNLVIKSFGSNVIAAYPASLGTYENGCKLVSSEVVWLPQQQLESAKALLLLESAKDGLYQNVHSRYPDASFMEREFREKLSREKLQNNQGHLQELNKNAN